MKRLRILALFSVCLALAVSYFKPEVPTTVKAGEGLLLPKEWLVTNKNPFTPKGDIRPADQTFLTFPEWFLVFSPAEQADYLEKKTATTFPYMSHVAQMWESYKIANDQIKDNFPPNDGYHLMIWVINTSSTVEYSLKAFYETVIGRITDTQNVITEEDKFNATFTRDYVNFINDKAWYEFDFKTRLRELWSTTPVFGNNLLRKFERRYLLTSELLIKYVYAKLIGLGTQSVYETALPTTAVILDTFPQPNSQFNIEKEYSDKSVLLYLPRYQKFASAVSELAFSGAQFKEIAGNNSAILLSILIPADKKLSFQNARLVFTQPITSKPAIKRMALAVPVTQLSDLLKQLKSKDIKVEHIFDY